MAEDNSYVSRYPIGVEIGSGNGHWDHLSKPTGMTQKMAT